jgi:glutaredoxin 3
VPFGGAWEQEARVTRVRRKNVEQLQTQKASIKFYTGNFCPYCRVVKKELERLNLDYETVDANSDGREEVMRLSGQRLIPILTIDDEVVADSSHIIRELRRRFG